MAHDEIERETVPLPDSETASTPAPAQGHLFGGADLDGGLGAEDEDGALGEGDGPIGAAIPAQDPAQSGADEADPGPGPGPGPDIVRN